MSVFAAAVGLDVRTLENPSTPISAPSDAVWEALAGASSSEAGISVNREKALTVAAWYRGLTLVSSDVAKAGCHVMRLKDGGWVHATQHPAYRLLRWRANPWTTAFCWHQTMTGHKKSIGNACSFVVRDGAGRPRELRVLDPSRVHPQRKAGRFFYEYESPDAGRIVPMPLEDVIHFKGFGYDGVTGYSTLVNARDSIGASIAMRQWGSKFFANLARLGIIIKHPASMKPEAEGKFLEGFRRFREGSENAWRSIIFQEGMEPVQPPQFDAEAAQLVPSRERESIEIANYHGVPPHKLGDIKGRTFASMEQEEQSYLSQSLDSEFAGNEQELYDKLLTEEEKASGEWSIQYDRNALVRADFASRTAGYKAALGGVPYLTVNEVRRDEGKPSLGPEYDKLVVPINMKEAAEPGSPASKTSPEPDAGGGKVGGEEEPAGRTMKGAVSVVVAEARARLVRRLGAEARKAAKEPATFDAWLGAMARTYASIAREVMAPSATLRAAADGRAAAVHAEELVAAVVGEVRAACERIAPGKVPTEFERAITAAVAALESTT